VKALPCPFCAWENIRVNVSKRKSGPLKGSEFSFAWCRVCGCRGPAAYTLGESDETVFKNTIERWNERNGKKIEDKMDKKIRSLEKVAKKEVKGLKQLEKMDKK